MGPEVLSDPRMEGASPECRGKSWGPRLSRFSWASSREGELPLKAERGSVWGLGWEEEVGGAEKLPGEAGTCLLLSALRLTQSLKGERSQGPDTPLPELQQPPLSKRVNVPPHLSCWWLLFCSTHWWTVI